MKNISIPSFVATCFHFHSTNHALNDLSECTPKPSVFPWKLNHWIRLCINWCEEKSTKYLRWASGIWPLIMKSCSGKSNNPSNPSIRVSKNKITLISYFWVKYRYYRRAHRKILHHTSELFKREEMRLHKNWNMKIDPEQSMWPTIISCVRVSGAIMSVRIIGLRGE